MALDHFTWWFASQYFGPDLFNHFQRPKRQSSSLATLLHGLNEEACQVFDTYASQSEVDAMSQKMLIRLSSDNTISKLVAV
jgi:hypothetical protein